MNRYLIYAPLIGTGSQEDPKRPDLDGMGFDNWGSIYDEDGIMHLIVETTLTLEQMQAIPNVTIIEQLL